MSTPIELAVPSAYKTSTLVGVYDSSVRIGKEMDLMYKLHKFEKEIFRVCGFPDHPNNEICVGLIGNVESIDTFFHPIITEDRVYVDCRAYVNKETKITDVAEYALKFHRGLLDWRWTLDKEMFNSVLELTVDIFSSWMSWGLERATGANIQVVTNYRVLIAIYYLGFFSTHAHDHNELDAFIIRKVSKICAVPARIIDELLTLDSEGLHDLFLVGSKNHIYDKLSVLAQALTNITSEETLVTPTLIKNAICRGAFIAGNPVEITAVSLEHPPTFIIMLSRIIGKSFQSQTTIGRSANNLIKKHDKNHFERFLAMNASIGV